jgi:hypothetical protein
METGTHIGAYTCSAVVGQKLIEFNGKGRYNNEQAHELVD